MTGEDQARLAALEAAERLDKLAEGAMQDAMTLGRFARRLQTGFQSDGRSVGAMRKYPDRNHYRVDEVREIVAELEAGQSPEYHKRREQARKYRQKENRHMAGVRLRHLISKLESAHELLESGAAIPDLAVAVEELFPKSIDRRLWELVCMSKAKESREHLRAGREARNAKQARSQSGNVVSFPGAAE